MQVESSRVSAFVNDNDNIISNTNSRAVHLTIVIFAAAMGQTLRSTERICTHFGSFSPLTCFRGVSPFRVEWEWPVSFRSLIAPIANLTFATSHRVVASDPVQDGAGVGRENAEERLTDEWNGH